MEKQQVVSWLNNMCQGKEWFHSVGFDQYDRIVVYVYRMNSEIMRFLPDRAEDGRQVLCHFAASVIKKADDFVNKPEEKKFGISTLVQAVEMASAGGMDVGFIGAMGKEADEIFAGLKKTQRTPEEEEQELELSVQTLTNELDKLERICGTNILGEIFFETHDKNNAITNLSVKFPEVRRRMEKLYDKYGFDLLYDELEL